MRKLLESQNQRYRANEESDFAEFESLRGELLGLTNNKEGVVPNYLRFTVIEMLCDAFENYPVGVCIKIIRGVICENKTRQIDCKA